MLTVSEYTSTEMSMDELPTKSTVAAQVTSAPTGIRSRMNPLRRLATEAHRRSLWQVLGNQTMLAGIDALAGPDVGVAMDSWSGYPAAKARLLTTIQQHAKNRAVVLTGDNHANWVHDIRGEGAAAAPVCTEFLGTSISSGGDGSDKPGFFTDAVAAENPHVKWANNRRGYMVCEVTPESWRTEFRTVAFVSKPDAPVETASRWRVTRGRPGVERE